MTKEIRRLKLELRTTFTELNPMLNKHSKWARRGKKPRSKYKMSEVEFQRMLVLMAEFSELSADLEEEIERKHRS